jgi:hypothetical protein
VLARQERLAEARALVDALSLERDRAREALATLRLRY